MAADVETEHFFFVMQPLLGPFGQRRNRRSHGFAFFSEKRHEAAILGITILHRVLDDSFKSCHEAFSVVREGVEAAGFDERFHHSLVEAHLRHSLREVVKALERAVFAAFSDEHFRVHCAYVANGGQSERNAVGAVRLAHN